MNTNIYYSSQKRLETVFNEKGRKQSFEVKFKNTVNLVREDATKDISIDQSKGISKDLPKDLPKEISKDLSKEMLIQWQKETREILIRLLGLSSIETCPLNPQLLEKVEIDNGILREKIVIQVEPDVYMPILILIPDKKNQKMIGNKPACILAPHGHQGGGKWSVAGCHEIPGITDAIKRFNYDYGLEAAKLGYIALCPDTRGFGERREVLNQDVEGSYEQLMSNSCLYLARMAEPLGLTVAGLCTWDLMRLIDYIEERKEWDTTRIGCIGFSGGGMQTLWLAALDERIRYAMISGYLYGYKDSLLKLHGNCSCNYVPGLWDQVDMGDIGALIAPRSVLIQSCEEDHLNGERGLINVYEQLDIMKKVYSGLGADSKLRFDKRPGGHCWHHEPMKSFLEEGCYE